MEMVDLSAGIMSGSSAQAVDIPLEGNPQDIVVNKSGSIAYVANWSSKSLDFVDLESKSLIRFVEVGDFPKSLVLNKDESRLYGCTETSVFYVDTADYSVQHINGLPGPRGLAFSPDETFFYVGVADYSKDSAARGEPFESLYVINTLTDEIEKKVVGPGVTNLVVRQGGSRVFVATYNESSVTAVDLNTSVVTPVLETQWPAVIAMDSARALVYVGGGEEISVFDALTQNVVVRHPVANSRSIVFNESGTLFYASIVFPSGISIVNAKTGIVVENINISSKALATNYTKQFLYSVEFGGISIFPLRLRT
ncbi:YncE family protein [Pseudomonas sp. NPDC087346]|uniref:YncE family protein n=1 Tax=Pseudomonas sp. NPDC087346 TaxID=3364438 RepID=UPI00380A2FBC